VLTALPPMLSKPTSRPRRGPDTPPKASPLPLPPRAPYVWTWTCHQCRSEFPLSCTQRCLYCSHQLCTTKTRDHHGKPCTPEFDYTGWAAWGAYRRSVTAVRADATALMPPNTAAGVRLGDTKDSLKRKRTKTLGVADHDTFATWELTTESHIRDGRVTQSRAWQPLPAAKCKEVSRRKERMYVQGRHRCQFHCDFPSECLHTVHTARVEGRTLPGGRARASLTTGG